MRPHIPKEEQACIRLKLLGNCDDDQCQYKHEGVTPVDRYDTTCMYSYPHQRVIDMVLCVCLLPLLLLKC